MQKYYKRLVAIFIALAFILSFSFVKFCERKDINKATYKELIQMQYIGEILAREIIQYTEDNTVNTVEELDSIPGIGEKRLNELKKKYK